MVMGIWSCSKDDTCDQKVTGTEVEKIVKPHVDTYYKYYITLDQGDRKETNKETVDFYTGRGSVCFEGYK